jgi:hypothetical protein
MIDIKNTIF